MTSQRAKADRRATIYSWVTSATGQHSGIPRHESRRNVGHCDRHRLYGLDGKLGRPTVKLLRVVHAVIFAIRPIFATQKKYYKFVNIANGFCFDMLLINVHWDRKKIKNEGMN